MPNSKEVKEWFQKAEDDFEGAVYLSRRRKKPLPDLVCFHSQQAAEKYLKAFLINQKTTFPKTHDLLFLLDLARKSRPDLELHRELFEYLNPYSIQSRYPGEEATQEEARIAIKTIKKIKRIMSDLF